MRRILVICGNPICDSFNEHLAETYKNSAKEKSEVRVHKISDMDFNMNLASGYNALPQLESDLKDFQDSLKWAQHVVIVAPIWWGSIPAKLKGLIDRTFLPGFAFRYENGSPIPKQLLVNKTARLILTMDTPPWYYLLVQGAPALKQLKIATLKFSGFKTVKTTMLGPVISASEAVRKAWEDKIFQLGLNAK